MTVKIEQVEVAKLKTPDRNVRIHPEYQIQELAKSLESFGQLRPVVTDEDFVVLVGNGLLEAAQIANLEKVDVCRLEGLSEHQKKKLMLADNKIFELGVTSMQAVKSFIGSLKVYDDLDIPGYEAEIVGLLISENDVLDGQLLADERMVVCPVCGDSLLFSEFERVEREVAENES